MSNVNDTSEQVTDKTEMKSDSTPQQQKSDLKKTISKSDIIAFLQLVVGIVIAVVAFRLEKASNQLNDTIRREALDTRNIATYQRYEDFFWSDDSVNEARAVAFFRRDGNLGYKCYYLYGEFIEAQNSLDPKRKERLQKYLINIFQVTSFDDIEKIKCK